MAPELNPRSTASEWEISVAAAGASFETPLQSHHNNDAEKLEIKQVSEDDAAYKDLPLESPEALSFPDSEDNNEISLSPGAVEENIPEDESFPDSEDNNEITLSPGAVEKNIPEDEISLSPGEVKEYILEDEVTEVNDELELTDDLQDYMSNEDLDAEKE
uniref:Uncharacterized protein n=1 Tax=Sphaerodactylus townsendi TaxID=933632 RepID=A0ACB8E907_9SAUR